MGRLRGAARKDLQPRWSIAYATAVALTLLSLLANVVTLSDGYAAAILLAIAGSLSASVVFAVSWRRLSPARRFLAVVLLAGNVWILCDAAGRRLPAVLNG